jgi:hypothetical protein
MKFEFSPFFTRPNATEPTAEFSNKHARSWLFGTPSIAVIATQVLLVILVHMLLRHALMVLREVVPNSAWRIHLIIQFYLLDWRLLAALGIAWHVRRARERKHRWEEWRVLPDFESQIRRAAMHAACVCGIAGTIWFRIAQPTISPIASRLWQARNELYFQQSLVSSLTIWAFFGRSGPPVGLPDAGFLLALEFAMQAVDLLGSVFLIYILATLLISSRRPFRAVLAFLALSWFADLVFIPWSVHVLIEWSAGIPPTAWNWSYYMHAEWVFQRRPGWDICTMRMWHDLTSMLTEVKLLFFLPLCRYLWWKFAQRESDV